jgi:nicotinamidase-related amidase
VTTLQGRPNSALIVVDVQQNVVQGAYRRDDIVANISSLVARARAHGVPVVWVQHSDDDLIKGSQGWQIVDELSPAPGEPVIEKHFNDAFEETTLEDELERLGVSRVMVSGAQTEWCVRSTLHGAVTRGYDTILVEDAHTTAEPHPESGEISTAQVIAHTNRYWCWHMAPHRECGIMSTAEVDFANRS